jgi:hypothetical protein
MTLIAALRIEGIPAMIGDFLITDEQIEAPHIYIPTRSNVSDPRTPGVPGVPKLPRRMAGLRRKIHIVNDNFIVGFTGSVKAGREIFERLERRFGTITTGPTIQEIDRTLRLFNVQYDKTAAVIGWTVRSRPRCFSWTAGPGSHAINVTHAIEGSGKGHFLTSIRNVRSFGYSPAVQTARDKATLMGLTRAGAVLFEEIASGENLAVGYGYGAEIALFTGSKFEMVPKLGYVFLHVNVGKDGTISIQPASIFAVYESRGRYSLMSITRLTPGSGVLNATDTYVSAITPLHDDMPELNSAVIGRPNQVCRYYFNGLTFFDAKANISGQIRAVTDRDPSFFQVSERNGLVHFEWNKAKRKMMLNYAVTEAANYAAS